MSFLFDNFSEGDKFQNNYTISQEVFDSYFQAFKDENPIHLDEKYAQSKGFLGRVMYGGILNGFVSNFIGVHFPGFNSLILSSSLSFHNPSYLGDIIQLEGTLFQKVDSVKVFVIHIFMQNLTQRHLAAKGKLEVRLL